MSMSISYDKICKFLSDTDLNGYKVATGGSGSTYVTLAPENYRDLHIVLWPNAAKDKIKIEFEVVNATAKNNPEIQSYCNKNNWEALTKNRKLERYKKDYHQKGKYYDFDSLEKLKEEIIAAQNIIELEFKEMEQIIDKSSPKKSRKNAQNTLSTYVPRQIIYFGAPGTSKSYTLNKDAEEIANQERVTFYPGYSYQQFVGTYKPFMDDDKISYKFVPGPLLRLLEKALKAEKAEKAEKAKPQEENKEDTPAAEASTENQENGKEEKDTEKFLLIVEELNRAEAAAVFGDLFQLLDRDSTGKSEYPISVSEDLKQYLCRKDGNDVGVWENEPEDTQKKLSFPSNFYIWATMNSADQGVFPLDTAFKRRWDFKYFGIDDAKDKLRNDKQKFWNNLRTTINDALQEKLNLNEDKLLGPFFMKVEENIDEQTFWEHFCSKVLLYLYEDAARLNRNRIFQSKITYSQMFAKFAEFRGVEEKWQDDLKTIWKTVFTFDVELKGDYPWAKAETEEDKSSGSEADNHEATGEPETDNNSDEMTDEQ